jgi:hypothetical protein
LDTTTIRSDDGSIKTTVYRKPTHTDQYLDFTSAHPEEHKRSVVRTLHHRAKSIISEPGDLKEELEYVNTALKRCNYPDYVLKSTEKLEKINVENTEKRVTRTCEKKSGVVLPYIKGTSDCLRGIFKKHKVNVAFRPHRTLRQMLVHPKDKTKKGDICGAAQ